MIMKNCFFILLCTIMYSCQSGSQPQPEPVKSAAGEQLYMNNCYQCHRAGAENLGPNLAGARSRWAEKSDLYAFVRDPQGVIAKNKYARDLQQQYNGMLMLPFPQLKNNEIDAILDYCDQLGK